MIRSHRWCRRCGALVLLFVFAASLAGCNESRAKATTDGKRLILPTQPFSVGKPEQYRRAGVYTTFRRSHGIWLASTGKMLVALSAACPADDCGTTYDAMAGQYRCPCDGSRFSTQGIRKGESLSPYSLDRLQIGLRDGRLIVTPTQTYRHEDNHWSHPSSLVLFE